MDNLKFREVKCISNTLYFFLCLVNENENVAPAEGALVPVNAATMTTAVATGGGALATVGGSMIIARKAPSMPKPKWHPPWKLFRVISGHLGWVRCVAVEPGNEWFATGSADRVIKV